MRTRVWLATTFLRVAPLLLATHASAYIRESTNAGIAVRRPDNTAIQVYINDKFVSGFTSAVTGKTVVTAGSDPVAALKAALDSWNTASPANVHFLPLQTTSTPTDNNDSLMVVGVATTGLDVSFVGSALAVTTLVYNNSGTIVSSDILFSARFAFSTIGPVSFAEDPYDLQAVVTHELGHAIGADHTNVLGGTMYPYAVGTFQRLISTDEIAFLNAAYPSASSPASGIIGGKVVSAGGAAISNPLIAVLDPATGFTVGTIGNAAGTWSVSVPTGSYVVYAEPFNSAVPANKYGVNAGSTPFQATVLGSPSSPTLTTVTAGNTAVANITVSTGATPFGTPELGSTTAGGPFVDWSTGGAAVLSAGQAADLIFFGTGFDATLRESNFIFFGPGITVRPGTVRSDPRLTVGGVPVLRVTVDVAARQTVALASVFVIKGTDTLSLTGTLVITPSVAAPPPSPSFTSKSVVSAASYLGAAGDGAVSPGGIYSIYTASGTSALGPPSVVLNAGFDPTGKLRTTLGGTTVTFDGVPAPLFISVGTQLNLQVPFEVAGKTSTKVIVTYNGTTSPAITVPVLPVQPAFFTVTPLGADSIVINPDGTLNKSTNAAARGSFVTIYGTGVGKVSYNIATGVGAPAPPPSFTGNYKVTLGSRTVDALFGGWTPTAVGLAQWNVQIPADSATGTLTLKVTDGATGVSSQTGTLYVK